MIFYCIKSTFSKQLSAVSIRNKGHRRYLHGMLEYMRIFMCAIAFLMNPYIADADRAASANKKGIEAYDKQSYEESVRHFTEALVERPDSPELKYNRGTTLSSLDKPEEALKELLSSAERLEVKEQSAAAHYNAGNTLFASEKLEAAIEEYKRAIKLDQNSEDYRHNLELAVRKMKQQQQEQEQDKDKENKQDEEGDEKNKQEQDKQEEQEEQEEKDEQQADKTRDPEEGEQKDQNQQQSQQQENEKMPMTEEEAQRLLDAINDEEKKALSQRYMQMKTDMRRGDDW